MTNHVLTQSRPAAAHGVLSRIAGFIRNWKARRAVTRLQDFDDYMLRDIGITRLDVQWASDLPLSTNAALALEERSFRRRQGRYRD